MPDQDVIDLVEYLIGSFALGFVVGMMINAFKKALEQV